MVSLEQNPRLRVKIKSQLEYGISGTKRGASRRGCATLGYRVSKKYHSDFPIRPRSLRHWGILTGFRVSLEYKLAFPDVATPLAPELGPNETVVSHALGGGLQLGFPCLEQGEEYGSLEGDLAHPGALQIQTPA
jgi:hypothetical protein